MRLAKLGDGRRVLGFKSMTPHPQLQQDMEAHKMLTQFRDKLLLHTFLFFFWNSKGGVDSALAHLI